MHDGGALRLLLGPAAWAIWPGSDIDVLVEFEPGKAPGLAFFDMADELSDILGRKVDLSAPGFLSRHIRDDVIAEAQVQYDAG